MKKLLLALSVLLLSFCSVSLAQTYAYKYLYTVDSETGVKSKEWSNERTIYITFTNNMNICYQSDKNGVKVNYFNPMQIYGTWEEGRDEYRYSSSNNGMFCYKQSIRTYHYVYGNKTLLSEVISYYNFSTDYNRLNTIWGEDTAVHVYERIKNKQPETPTTLW